MISSAEEFARLRTSEDLREQARAGTDEASIDVWLDVVGRFPNLREWVVHNKTVPLQILALLARDSSAAVRFTVAGKLKLSSELQVLLAKDPDSSVRHGLACNAKCEISVLKILAEDREPFVRAAAAERLERRSDAL